GDGEAGQLVVEQHARSPDGVDSQETTGHEERKRQQEHPGVAAPVGRLARDVGEDGGAAADGEEQHDMEPRTAGSAPPSRPRAPSREPDLDRDPMKARAGSMRTRRRRRAGWKRRWSSILVGRGGITDAGQHNRLGRAHGTRTTQEGGLAVRRCSPARYLQGVPVTAWWVLTGPGTSPSRRNQPSPPS